MKRLHGFSLAVGAAALGALVFGSNLGHAGDRQLGLRFVNMTPDDDSTPASKKCVQSLRDRAAQDYVDLKPMTETPLRKLIAAEDKSESFMLWTKARAKAAVDDTDSFFAVDCRPEKQHLDALLINKTGARVQFRLRGEPIDTARALWTMDEILRHAWSGFDL